VQIFLPAGNHATLYNYTLQMRSGAGERLLRPDRGNVRKIRLWAQQSALRLCEQAAGAVDGSHEGGNLAVAAFFAVRLLSRDGPCSL